MMETTNTEKKAFKDWFDKQAAKALAKQVKLAWPRFDEKAFVRLSTRNLASLEFQARVQQFSDALATTLPEEKPKAITLLAESLPRAMPDCEAVTNGWLQWPIGQFIADHGQDHFKESMAAMIELTQRFSSEFAVRPFVERYPKQTFRHLLKMAHHPSPHVRRWCSEGVRPRLPWGNRLRRLVEDPSPLWPILEALKDDDELYVRRSVANCLNDISKDHPKLVVARCKAWSEGCHGRRDWVIRHALRSLLKAGDRDALALIGYKAPRQLRASIRISPKRIAIGDTVRIVARLETDSARKQNLMVDYVIHYVRKGKSGSGKVFKWKTLSLPAGETVQLEKTHSMRQTTVRALYPGIHRVELQVNGQRVTEASFRLTG